MVTTKRKKKKKRFYNKNDIPIEKMREYLPETHRLYDVTDRNRFFLQLPCENLDGSMYIFKYSTSSGGRGLIKEMGEKKKGEWRVQIRVG